ncbi:MAG TPA: DUF5615 family PIN-like protein [Candidatus Limnocylindrales bacterium]|nr:DUF5615 family PIN-like protein [Candidatus Limnocylindrales bacterium]
MRLLLDEMYSPALAEALHRRGIEAHTVRERGLAGQSDDGILAAAATEGLTVLTENVADVAGLAAARIAAGQHPAGVLIALSSRFSRRPAGVPVLVVAIVAVADQPLDDRTNYLQRADDRGRGR